jgi:hypothetical protein
MGRDKSSLTVGQYEVLEWVAADCPGGMYESGYAHRITARALESRGLVAITGRGDTWLAAITDAGTAYLAAAGEREPEPEPDATEALLARVLSEGRIEFDEKQEDVGYEKLVALSMNSPARPFGKKLLIVRVGAYWESTRMIQLTEHFPDRVDARAVPVAERVRVYDPAVTAFLKDKDWQYVSAEHVTRAGRILQAITAEAARRGYRVLGRHQTGHQTGHQQAGARAPQPRKGHLVVAIEGQEYGVDLREKPLPGAQKLPPRDWTKPRRLPQWLERRNYEFLPSGVLELTIDGGWGHDRPSVFRGRKSTRLEDLLPDVFREMEIRVLEAQWQAEEAARAKQARKTRWEAAMAEARLDFLEAQRGQELGRQAAAWRERQELEEYLAAMTEKADGLAGEERAAAQEWLGWAHRYAQALDPLEAPLGMPRLREPTPDELKPFLNGWNPYGPDR